MPMHQGESQTNVQAHSGHNRHAGHSVAMFRDKFWLCLALTLPVVFWSIEVQHWLGYRAPKRGSADDRKHSLRYPRERRRL